MEIKEYNELTGKIKDNVLSETKTINKYLSHKPLSYNKKLYVGEFIVEKLIHIIAFVSIGAIIAIFYYVFQEATFTFKSADEHHSEQVIKEGSENRNESEDLTPESYTPESYSSDGDNKQKTETLQPEQYKPEQYGVEKTDVDASKELSGIDELKRSSLESESAGAEINVGFSTLFLPNSFFEDKPAYIWQPISHEPKYSLIPLFIGSLKVTLVGIVFAAPIGVLAAIFTVAFANRWLREVIKPAIEVLAGFPSVVLGFFCLITLASVIQGLFGTTFRLNSFVGGIGMALAVIPIIYTVTEDALSAIPKHLSEASLALGASRWQTAYRVILPAATPGVFAAIILGFGRAFGETMIALMATGNAAIVSGDIFDSVRTMAATIGAEMAEVEFRSVHYGLLFLIGSMLFVVTFSLNALAEFYIRKRLLKRFQGN